MADTAPRRTRVLVVDDHTLFRHGLRALLESIADVELIGEAATGEEALAQVQGLAPDVVLMDINMPDLNGIAATRHIMEARPATAVVMLTMHAGDDSLFAAMRAGARGYVLKGADETELLRVVRAAAQGEALFGPAIAQRLMHFFGDERTRVPEFPQLSEREREVLILIAQGWSNAVIAERLVLSPKTVRNHISNIFSKLQVADRAEAIVRAREAGMGH
ncbi:MAG TPA: response regulator transcription factor [Chloroflexota bacterium]|nr:response regulator transcription factor [Chloroflexota bacterium]